MRLDLSCAIAADASNGNPNQIDQDITPLQLAVALAATAPGGFSLARTSTPGAVVT